MDSLFAPLLLLSEAALMALAFGLLILGAFAAHFGRKVQFPLRRVSYLWGLVLANLALVLVQSVWGFTPAAADAGVLWLLILFGFGGVFVFGWLVYKLSAARSNDIRGDPSRAWLGFVPVANLWLIFTPGRGAASGQGAAAERSALARYAGDPLAVVAALAVFALSHGLSSYLEDQPAYDTSDSIALNRMLSAAQSVEDSLAREAELSAAQLPLRIDEITVMRAIRAEGRRLTVTLDVEEEMEFDPAFADLVSGDLCDEAMFGPDIKRGATIVYIYRGPDGAPLLTVDVTVDDCSDGA